MVFSLAACGGGSSETPAPETTTPAETAPAETASATDMKVAMITDYGDITDQSFNTLPIFFAFPVKNDWLFPSQTVVLTHVFSDPRIPPGRPML